jgi:hypothetical protein
MVRLPSDVDGESMLDCYRGAARSLGLDVVLALVSDADGCHCHLLDPAALGRLHDSPRWWADDVLRACAAGDGGRHIDLGGWRETWIAGERERATREAAGLRLMYDLRPDLVGELRDRIEREVRPPDPPGGARHAHADRPAGPGT